MRSPRLWECMAASEMSDMATRLKAVLIFSCSLPSLCCCLCFLDALLLIAVSLLNLHFTFLPCSFSSSCVLGDGDDSRPGMRGGHQMVIDVQTGKVPRLNIKHWILLKIARDGSCVWGFIYKNFYFFFKLFLSETKCRDLSRVANLSSEIKKSIPVTWCGQCLSYPVTSELRLRQHCRSYRHSNAAMETCPAHCCSTALQL